jgi:hypothetical protein
MRSLPLCVTCLEPVSNAAVLNEPVGDCDDCAVTRIAREMQIRREQIESATQAVYLAHQLGL